MAHYNPKDAEGFINLFALPVTATATPTARAARIRQVNAGAKPVSETTKPAAADKLWGGRFDRAPDELFYEFQRSLPFDRRLLPYELAVDRAWARALERVNILTAAELNQTLGAIDSIAERAAADPAWVENSPAEDVHHFVEMALVERLGPLGYKLHTARSRNELVAADFRLFVKDAARETSAAVRGLIARAGRFCRTRHWACPWPA